MNINKINKLGFALVLTFILAGCGGGGGGSVGGNPVVGVGNAIATQLQDEVRHIVAVGVAQEAARATPTEGSVTQSSNVLNGVTEDSVSADVSYENGGITFSLAGLGQPGGTFDIIGRGTSGSGGITYRTRDLLQTSSEGSLWVRVNTDREAPRTQPIPAGSPVLLMTGDQLDFDYSIIDQTSRFGDFSGDSRQLTNFVLNELLVGSVNGVQGTFSCGVVSLIECGGIFSAAALIGVEITNDIIAFKTSMTSSFSQTAVDVAVFAYASSIRLPVTIYFTPGGGTETVLDTDYLVGGHWLFVPNGDDLSELGIGAFADGPDADLTPASYLTTPRSATYSGKGSGLYLEESGAGDGTTNRRVGNFDADVTLTAAFGNTHTISGRVENIAIDGISNARVPRLLTLADADVPNKDGGFFTGNTSATALKTDGINTYAYTGKWGGQFYGDEADYIGGTFGASTSNNPRDGNYKASFIGAFGAYKD